MSSDILLWSAVVGCVYLHAVNGVRQAAGFVDEVSVFHVLRDPLQKAQWLVEHHRHCYFRKFLKHHENKQIYMLEL